MEADQEFDGRQIRSFLRAISDYDRPLTPRPGIEHP
jgi:hypothetical protein